MMYVETNNPRQQLLLEQQFSREGNLFGVPIKKTSQIAQILSALLFEVFQEPNSPTELKKKPTHPLSKLVQKLATLFSSILNLTFSLTQIRQILEIIKIQSTKIMLYEDYIQQLTTHLNYDSDQDSNESFHANYNDEFRPQEYQFQEDEARHNFKNEILEMDYTNTECQNEPDTQQSTTTATKPRNSMVSIQCKYDSPTDEDAQTMHTLKSQFTSSPKFSRTPLAQTQIDKKRFTNNRIDQLENSLNYSQDDKKSEDEYLINVQDEMRLQTTNNTSNFFYCPEWKKNQDDQKKVVKSLAPNQPKKASSNDSNYIENLSGRVHPVPSFLHDDSLGEMIVKQKKEDVRKSNILRKSIHGIQQNKAASDQYAYSSNLRLIKFHNKLRRNSKKSIGSKKDIQQLRSQQLDQRKEQQIKPTGKDKNTKFMSDDRLFRPKQKASEQEIPKKTIKAEDLIESKLKAERKNTQPKNKFTRTSNFFKSNKQ